MTLKKESSIEKLLNSSISLLKYCRQSANIIFPEPEVHQRISEDFIVFFEVKELGTGLMIRKDV
jgi:hypothetical protein